MTPQEAAEQYALKFKTQASSEGLDNIKDDFLAGAKWQAEQDDQALSSALKEIAELLAKVKNLETDIYHAECNLDISNRRVKELESKPNNFM